MFEINPEVLIVGAGPVGLFAALSLAKRRIPIQIVDTGVWAGTHSYALALHPRAHSLLSEVGLWDQAIAGAYPVRTIGLYDRDRRRAQVRLDTDPDASLAVVRQDHLEELLEKSLEQLDVRVLWRHEVSRLSVESHSVTATVDKYVRESRGYSVAHTEWVIDKSAEVEVPFIIGADGHGSRVRRALNIDFPEVGPAQYYAVFEFKSNADLDHEMKIVFLEDSTSVLWPLPGGFCRWSVEMPDYSDRNAEEMKDRLLASGFGHRPTERTKDRMLTGGGGAPVLEEERLRDFIEERAPWFKGSVEGFTWRTVVRFERRLATSFGRNRVWLAGDAAHLTGPAGVQSMNLGLFEAYELAKVMTRVLRASGSSAELDGYNERWLARWQQLEGLKGGLKAGPKADPWVAQYAGRLLSCLPGYGADFTDFAGQLGLEVK